MSSCLGFCLASDVVKIAEYQINHSVVLIIPVIILESTGNLIYISDKNQFSTLLLYASNQRKANITVLFAGPVQVVLDFQPSL